MAPSAGDLRQLFETKYRAPEGLGWGPRLRRDFGYYQPDDYYEALLKNLITEDCAWADVGCGRDIFPLNRMLAANLAKRARHVLGIDPDDNINENPFLTERFQGVVEDYSATTTFDVITMRMVAEHVQDPERVVRRLAAMTAAGGVVVVFTPNKWSPMSVVAKATPFRLHHPLKRLIWGSEEQDTFPVAYKLNSRRALADRFQRHGLQMVFFAYLDACTVFRRWRLATRLELRIRDLCYRAGMPYFENCLLAAFEKA